MRTKVRNDFWYAIYLIEITYYNHKRFYIGHVLNASIYKKRLKKKFNLKNKKIKESNKDYTYRLYEGVLDTHISNDFIFNCERIQEETNYFTNLNSYEILDKFGKIRILEFCKGNELHNRKKYWIKHYNSVTMGLNTLNEIDNELDTINKDKENGTYCVYQHISPSGKSYIGITSFQDNPNRRWNNGKGYAGQRKFYNAIKKYGWDNLKHVILKRDLSLESAWYWEMYYIKEFNCINNGYNCTEGGKYTDFVGYYEDELDNDSDG